MTEVIGCFGGREDDSALEHGIEEARRRGLGIVVVRATARSGQEGDVAGRLERSGVEHLVHESRLPDPAEDVLQATHEHGAALIVIGIRRRSPVGKIILGSNAQRVLLEADVPVLAVKRRG